MINPTDDEGMFRAVVDHMVALWCLGNAVPEGETVIVSAEVTDEGTLTLIIGIGVPAMERMCAERTDSIPWRVLLPDPTRPVAPRHGANGGPREPDGPARYWPVERYPGRGGE